MAREIGERMATQAQVAVFTIKICSGRARISPINTVAARWIAQQRQVGY